MRSALVIALETPDCSLPRSYSYDYGFPRTAVLLATCIKQWGRKLGFSPTILNVDAVLRRKVSQQKKSAIKEFHKEAVEQAIHEYNPELICIIAPYTHVANWAISTARICRNYNQHSVIITGGPHATFLAHELLKLPDRPFDAVVLGPGESKLKHILENFDNDLSRFDYPGIATTEKPSIYLKDAQKNDVKVPPIDYDLISQDVSDWGDTIVMAGRGCGHSCKFCLESIYWRKAKITFSTKANIVRRELLKLNQLGVSVIGCGDSIIDMRTEEFSEFCRIAFSGTELTDHFFILTRLHMLNDRGCKSFRQSGGRAVLIGLETANREMLASMGKAEIPDLLEEKLFIAKNNELNVGAFFMFGYPGETVETAKASIELIKRLFNAKLIDYLEPSIFTPYPGLPMYDRPDDFGIIPYKSAWKNWDLWGRYHELPVYDLKALKREAIFSYWKQAWEIKRKCDIRELEIIRRSN